MTPEQLWAGVLERVKGHSPDRLAMVAAARTYELILRDGRCVRPLDSVSAFGVVAAVCGVCAEELRAELRNRAPALGPEALQSASEVRTLLLRDEAIGDVRDPRDRGADGYLASMFTPDPAPALVCRPRAEFSWRPEDVAAFPFLAELSSRWSAWLTTNKPSDDQLYRKALIALYPSYRAAGHCGDEFVAPPDSEVVASTRVPIRSARQYARQIGPLLTYEWNHRNEVLDSAATFLAFIVHGRP